MSAAAQIEFDTLPDKMACLMIPMQSVSLLLPNEAVAEVVRGIRPEKLPDMPEWYLGQAEWRGLKIPVLSYEQLADGSPTRATQSSCLIVINSLKENRKQPFYALLSAQHPRLLRLNKKDLVDGEASTGINKYAVVANGNAAIVPDLELLEEKLTAH
ncbi:MAG TPA: chemotaxis protein CheW [Pseudomonadales bacterium]|nr:chemotaxis protein CheW [Pseudomonadales bacterium]